MPNLPSAKLTCTKLTNIRYLCTKSSIENYPLDKAETIYSNHGRKLLVRPAICIQRKGGVFVKRQPTANSTANESSSESDTLPLHWIEAANILKEDTSRGYSRQTGHLAERRGARNLQLNLAPQEQDGILPSMLHLSPFSQPLY